MSNISYAGKTYCARTPEMEVEVDKRAQNEMARAETVQMGALLRQQSPA